MMKFLYKNYFVGALLLLSMPCFTLMARVAEPHQPSRLIEYGSPEQYYNEALSAEKNGNNCEASLALRRALVLDPTLAPAREHLAALLEKMGLPVDTSWRARAAAHISPELLMLLGMLLGWSSAILVVWIFFIRHAWTSYPTFAIGNNDFSQYTRPQDVFSNHLGMIHTPHDFKNHLETKSLQKLSTSNCESRAKRKFFFSLGMIFFFIGHGMTLLGFMIDPRVAARHQVVLFPRQGALENETKDIVTPLRVTPVDNGEVVTQLPAGSLLNLISEHGAWSYVRTSSGQEGWIGSSSMESLIP